MNLPINAKRLIDMINEQGYRAYAVGGFVRDSIMGIECGDIDITSSATPDELETILESNNIKFVETGIKHGTVSAIIDHIPYEITTFRTDGEYGDNRHPDDVLFVRNIEDDLARRDFTINAIAYNDADGVVDLFGGVEDINNRIIRCVGDADRRFQEDALRIMRAIRFASVLGFDIEDKTKKAIHDNKELLKNIAFERIFVELRKLLLGDNVESVLAEYRDVIAVIIPEIAHSFDFPQNTKWHLYDVYTHTIKSVALAPKVDYIRLTLLLHDIGKPFCKKTDENGVDHFKGHALVSADMSKSILKRFKVSNDLYNKIIPLIENHARYIKDDSANIKMWLRALGEELTLDYIDVKIADLSSHNLDLSQSEIDTLYDIKDRTISIINSNEPYLISHLAINGNDLIEMGYKGKDIAIKLNELVELVSEHPELNTRENLKKEV